MTQTTTHNSLDRKVFFNYLRVNPPLGPVLSAEEVDGVTHILDYMQDWPLHWMAYGFATVFHETAGHMRPIREFGGNGYLENNYGIRGKNPGRARLHGHTQVGDGYKYCGQGLVQITWKDNYQKFGHLLGIDLVGHPELALQWDHSLAIMKIGMERGIFTGRKLSDYLGDHVDYVQARRIINGQDAAQQIAHYADIFDNGLQRAGYRLITN